MSGSAADLTAEIRGIVERPEDCPPGPAGVSSEDSVARQGPFKTIFLKEAEETGCDEHRQAVRRIPRI